MKTDTIEPDLERSPGAVEEKNRSGGAGQSILRRAVRISRVKLYLLSRRRPVMRERLRSLSFEGKVMLSFILSLLALSVPASLPGAHSGSPAVTALKLLAGIADFMAAMVPLIIAVFGIYVCFAIVCRLVKDYTV